MKRTVVQVAVVVSVSVAAAAGIVSAASNPNLSVGGPVTQVKTSYGENLIGTSGTAWAAVDAIKVTVPQGEKGLVVARFDGSAYCEPMTPPSTLDASCQLRILAKTPSTQVALNPKSMIDMLSVEGGVTGEDYSLTLEKSRVLGTGTWTIVVQHRVTDPDAYFGIYTHHLTVERARV